MAMPSRGRSARNRTIPGSMLRSTSPMRANVGRGSRNGLLASSCGLSTERERRFVRSQRRLEPGERLILHSDGITARKTPHGLFGLDGLEKAIRSAESRSAPAIARAIQEAVMASTDEPLQDDAVAIVLAPAAA